MTDAERLNRDDVARGLSHFEQELSVTLGPEAVVDRTDYMGGRISAVTVLPTNPSAIGFAWTEMLDEVVLEVGHSGRWELDHTVEDLALLKAIVQAVLAGHAVETQTRKGLEISVRLEDGTTVHSARR